LDFILTVWSRYPATKGGGRRHVDVLSLRPPFGRPTGAARHSGPGKARRYVFGRGQQPGARIVSRGALGSQTNL